MESCSALAQGPDQLPQGLLRVKHRFGDSVQPSYEGWHRQDDGTISMWFGYYNRNTEERVNVPIGPQNKFDLPVADQGQPGYFYPGYHQFVFRVDLPKDWSADKKIVWTLVANGVTLTANGWMVPGYEVDAGVISMNLSSAGGSAEGNNPPVVVGAADQTVEMGKPLKLTVTATDDGFPKPRSTRGSTVQIGGIQLRWEEYRGAGDVEFDPPNVTGEYGKSIEATTLAQFSTPGTYWVRAIGSDTQLEGFHDFKVMVTQPHH
jgi:hypothetical protein